MRLHYSTKGFALGFQVFAIHFGILIRCYSILCSAFHNLLSRKGLELIGSAAHTILQLFTATPAHDTIGSILRKWTEGTCDNEAECLSYLSFGIFPPPLPFLLDHNLTPNLLVRGDFVQ
jgi:hypothetical protein